MKARIVKKGNQTDKLLKELNQQTKVHVGHYNDQGEHYSGMTYPDLMKLHHNGTGAGRGEIPARPVLDILAFRVNNNIRKVFFGVSNVFKKGTYSANVIKYLTKVGSVLKGMERDVFGDTSALTSNRPKTVSLKQGRDQPLVDTEDLRNKIEVRIKK